MNGVVYVDGCYHYHKVSNAEFSGVFGGDCHHIFIKYGDKVYMEANGIGDVVISFSELQSSKYWKQFYDLSLLLTNDKHNMAHDIVFSSKNTNYANIYNEARHWSINTAYLETVEAAEAAEADTKFIKCGYVCYYKINPYDLADMEYTSQEDLDIFQQKYANRMPDDIDVVLANYNALAIEHIANKEAEETEETEEAEEAAEC
uniref:Uncharacterized protein n=1 Tax=viral metagenome TaxID=1070528 RepID=A0A6C0LL23_9ZZZZ